jgi:hypothetical protein
MSKVLETPLFSKREGYTAVTIEIVGQRLRNLGRSCDFEKPEDVSVALQTSKSGFAHFVHFFVCPMRGFFCFFVASLDYECSL